MNRASASTLSVEAPSAALPAVGGEGGWASWSLLGLIWLLVFNQERLEWMVNPTYGYGWAVPALAGYLLWERWRCRPAAGEAGSAGWMWFPLFLVAAYLPLRIIQEANPDWVKVNWSMAGVAIGLTLAAAYSLGGWRYVFHFAFPVLFCLTALPWPVWLETSITQGLMGFNAGVCADTLSLMGEPALAHGNLIEVNHAWVNVEEACSGIRSLQTAFMMSLFFGEYHRLALWGRAALLASSFAVAFILNLGRTLLLTHLTAIGGGALNEKWHDRIGNSEMILCLVSLWLLAEFVSRARRRKVAVAAKQAPLRAPYSTRFALGSVVWLVSAEALTAAWYGVHEWKTAAPLAWRIDWPSRALKFRNQPFEDRTRALLKYNEGSSASWVSPEGYFWQSYYLRWYPGRVSKFLSESHYPTVCLPAAGMTLVQENGVRIVHVGRLGIPFRTYVFERGGHQIYVFHAIIEDVPSTATVAPLEYYQATSTDRLLSCLRGERNRGQRVLGIAITGPDSEDSAIASLESTLPRMVEFQ